MDVLIYIAIAVVAIALGVLATLLIQKAMGRSRAQIIIDEARREGEVLRQKEVLKGREEGMKIKDDAERQANQRLQRVQSSESKMKQRESQLNQQQSENQRTRNELEAARTKIDEQHAANEARRDELERMTASVRQTLEHISGLSSDEAKEKLIESLKDEAKTAAASYINDIMDDAKMTANKEAKRIIVQTIQRTATETAIENSVTVFHIDSDEIKGRIIGREGRNIRALEAATGIEIIVDDTPEAIVLSGFDPVRREIARLALHQLVSDGRIHPARIEEVVAKVRKQIEEEIIETGKRTAIDLGIHGLHPDLIRMVGKMKYRSSYGQNLLQHSRETANLCAIMAAELGLNPKKARRAGLLHDIGKALSHEIEGSHVQIGVEVCKKYKENAEVVHAIEAHHGDVEVKTVIAALVQAADAISAARPAARSENYESYIKRLEKLEEICCSYEGVEKSYAIQAGREVRILIKPEVVNDQRMVVLAREIAQRIENEMEYPGQIKVNLIRESRTVDYAK